MERLLLTAEEIAEVMDLGRSKVYELMRAGLIDSIPIGTRRRVPVSAIKESVERMRSSDGDSDIHGRPVTAVRA